MDAIETWRELFLTKPRDEWVRALEETACVGPVNDFAEAASEPRAVERGMVVDQGHPEGITAQQIGSPVRLRNRPVGIRTPAPALGADTRELLAEASYSEERIASLLESGAAAD